MPVSRSYKDIVIIDYLTAFKTRKEGKCNSLCSSRSDAGENAPVSATSSIRICLFLHLNKANSPGSVNRTQFQLFRVHCATFPAGKVAHTCGSHMLCHFYPLKPILSTLPRSGYKLLCTAQPHLTAQPSKSAPKNARVSNLQVDLHNRYASIELVQIYCNYILFNSF